jgi:hypothetical protein
MAGLAESKILLRLLMSRVGISDGRGLTLACPTLDKFSGKDKPPLCDWELALPFNQIKFERWIHKAAPRSLLLAAPVFPDRLTCLCRTN